MQSKTKIHTDRLRKLREDRGWSQRELARRCDFAETQVRRYEMGLVDPSATNLGILADVFQVSADFLLGRTDIPQPYLNEAGLNADEASLVAHFRREGWPGVVHLGVERIAKPVT